MAAWSCRHVGAKALLPLVACAVGVVSVEGAVAAASAADPAISDDYLDLSLDQLMQIELTSASSFPQTPFDASATASRVDDKAWRRRAARTIAEALEYEPGVMLLSAPTGGTLIQVRGYASTSLRGRATLFDGVPVNTLAFGSEVFSNGRLPLALLDNVELVRGPSSVLYGSDAFHSAVIMKPVDGASDRVELRVSDNDYSELNGRGSARVVHNRFDYAIAAREQGEQDVAFDYRAVDASIRTAQRDEQYRSGAAYGRWRWSGDNWNTSVSMLHDHHDASDFSGGGTIIGDTTQYDRGDQNSDLSLLKVSASRPLPQGEFVSSAYHWRNDYGQQFYQFLLDEGRLALERQQFLETRQGFALTWRNPDLRMPGVQASELSVAAGFEQAEIVEHDFSRNAVDTAPITQRFADYEGLTNHIASLQLDGKTYIDGKHWQLVYGGRIDDYSTFGAEWSPRFGVIVRPSDRDSIRLLYSQAFRAPNANELRGTSFARGDEDLEPETLESFELGYLRAWSSLSAELVAFRSNWSERIISRLVQLDGRTVLRYGNSGHSDSRGMESRLHYRNMNSMLDFALTWTDSEGKEGAWVSNLFPRWMATATAGHSWPAWQLETSVSARYHDSVAVGDEAIPDMALPQTGSYVRIDWSLIKRVDAQWQVQLAVRNLFDRDNVIPSIVNSRGGIDEAGRELELATLYQF